MKKIIIKSIYILIIIIEIIIFKLYNENYQSKQTIKIEKQSINYILNKINNPNIITDDEPIINYDMILEIPKINLKKGILSKDNPANNIDENVTILQESYYPDEEGNIFLAAHSGNGNKSYFNNLTKLSLNDNAYLYYNNKKYIFSLMEIKEVNKNNSLSLQTTSNNSLILITCSQKNKSKYLILILNKQKETEYNELHPLE